MGLGVGMGLNVGPVNVTCWMERTLVAVAAVVSLVEFALGPEAVFVTIGPPFLIATFCGNVGDCRRFAFGLLRELSLDSDLGSSFGFGES
jgi:hypothetical protein